MTTHYPLGEADATPEYVFGVLREMYRSGLSWGELTWDTPVPEFLDACDAMDGDSAQCLAECLNAATRSTIPLDEWNRAFAVTTRRTVGDVCEFLAPRITRPVVRPWNHAAGACLPAGAFLTVRTLLVERGLDSGAITPSARLDCLSEDDLHFLYWRLSLIEPGRISSVSFTFRTLGVRCFAGLCSVVTGTVGGVALLLLLLALTLRDTSMGTGAVAVVAASVAAFRWLGRYQLPLTAHLGELRTFRDLAYSLAGQQPRRRIQPSA